MQFKTFGNWPSWKPMAGILFLIFSCFLLAGCSQKEEAEDPTAPGKNDSAAQSKEAIQSVIEKEFNGPDKKYRELWAAVAEAQKATMSQEEYDAFLETPVYEEFNAYMADTYASYFTDNGYDLFIGATPAFLYSAFQGDYKLSTSDIEITPSENEPTSYNFTFNVTYENGNEETEQYNFEGKAIVPEKGKIGKIEFFDKDGLQQKLNDVNFEELAT